MQYNMKQLNIYLKSKAPIMFTSKKKKRERNQMREPMVLTQWVNNWITPLNALNMESEANFTSAESTYTFNFSMYLSGPTKTLHTASTCTIMTPQSWLFSKPLFILTPFQCWLKTLVSLRVIIIKASAAALTCTTVQLEIFARRKFSPFSPTVLMHENFILWIFVSNYTCSYRASGHLYHISLNTSAMQGYIAGLGETYIQRKFSALW